MTDLFQYDVFLSYSSKDKAEVRTVAERLRADGLRVWFDEWEIKPGDSIPAKIEAGLEQTHILILFMSVHAFGSDWAILESHTFRFRDPLNKERRFIPLRLDNTPIKGSLAQFLYINWLPADRDQEYAKLYEACRPPASLVSQYSAKQRFQIEMLPLGQTASTNSMAISHDGNFAISGADDGIVRFWEVSTGNCLRVFEGHTDSVISVALSQNGKIAISGADDRTVRIWEVSTGHCLAVLERHTARAFSVALNHDGQLALCGSEDKTIRLWEVNSGFCLRELKGHADFIRSVALSHDARFVLSGADDKTLRLWVIVSIL